MARETGRQGYKVKLKAKLEKLFPGCEIWDNDPARTHQGIPDMTILYGNRWAMLEAKASAIAEVQPNQPYWVEYYNERSFASFIYPENESEVLDALQLALAPSRKSRNTKR